jgi:predicted ABC-type ATPase
VTLELHAQIAEALAADRPILIVLAGSNGAGKSTYYRAALSDTGLPFINADELAVAMRPDDPGAVAYEAMRAAEARRGEALRNRDSFIMETVLSDPHGAKLSFLGRAQEAGYCVVVIYIRIASPELSRARVMQRVAAGGHDVPDAKLLERFPRTVANARKALALANLGLVLDNSAQREPYKFVESWRNGRRSAQVRTGTP